MGVSRAARDHDRFDSARTLLIVCIVLSVAAPVLMLRFLADAVTMLSAPDPAAQSAPRTEDKGRSGA